MARIVVGIGGGIAAYKVATVVSRLVQEGHSVNTVLTHGATQFIGAAAFTALCGRPRCGGCLRSTLSVGTAHYI